MAVHGGKLLNILVNIGLSGQRGGIALACRNSAAPAQERLLLGTGVAIGLSSYLPMISARRNFLKLMAPCCSGSP